MIQNLKLITTEEIVADTEYNAQLDEWTLTNPVRFILTEENSVVLYPLMSYSLEKTLKIKGCHVICAALAAENIKNIFNEKFGGITTITPKLVIPGL